MDKLKKSVNDNIDVIQQKTTTIMNQIESNQERLYKQESVFINNIVRKLSDILEIEEFSCKYGKLIYRFEHDDKYREVFISPEVYLIDNDCVVYEVINPKKYYEVTANEILISKNGKYFCEIQLTQFLRYVSLEDIINFIEKQINKDFEELKSLQKRFNFIQSFSGYNL